MARALWSGALSFGLVTIPVEVHTAVRERALKFHLLRKSDRSRIKYQKIAERDGEPVEWDQLVKGFEYEKGSFIVLTPEDFASAALQKDRTITILDFVEGDEIDDRYFDKPYYLTPGKGGNHAYAVLRECIRGTNLIGVAKFVLRDRQHLAAVEVIGDALVLSVLRFADELVDVNTLSFPAAGDVRKPELETARLLVNAFKTSWKPEQYTDEYKRNLLEIIKAKQSKGKKAALRDPQDHGHAEVVDLMERLRKSLQGRGAAAGARKSSRKAPARKRTASKGGKRRSGSRAA
jgi:DNA end-binding protein Ku